MQIKKIEFQKHGDERGMLIALEENKEIPFSVKRVYCIYETKAGVRRGYHAHKKLKQVLACVKGTCKLHLDDGTEIAEVVLDRPEVGIYLDSGIWREMYDFSSDAVLLVLASEFYDEADYIRNYQDFIKFVKTKEK